MGIRSVILLDTHVLVWAVGDSKKLSRAAASEIRRARRQDGLAVSAITLWEVARLIAHDKVRTSGTIESSLRLMFENVSVRPITPEIAVLASQFPASYSHDPADRLIGATARAEGLTLITRDEKMRDSPLLKCIW
jgi:PIN domain nuclease of toxin-antitoxin system